MSIQTKTYLTPEEYLAIERKADTRSEYFAGEMFAMGGASRNHNQIVMNLGAELRNQLKDRTCNAYSIDLRLQVSATGMYTYPDIVVVCGVERFLDEKADTLLNPTVIVEVLSESTQAYDRGRKFEHYRSLESLQEYVLVDQVKPHVEQYVKQQDGKWLMGEFGYLSDVLVMNTIGCSIPLAEICHKIAFQGLEK